MSQAVTSVSNHPSVVTANDSSSNSSVYAATTSTVTTISPCPTQQQYSPPQSSVTSQYVHLPYSEGFQVSNTLEILYVYRLSVLKQ